MEKISAPIVSYLKAEQLEKTTICMEKLMENYIGYKFYLAGAYIPT